MQVSADQSGAIKVWDIAYDEEMDHIQAHKGEITALHYNAEFPSKLMSGGAYPDDTIKIWDRYHFEHPRTFCPCAHAQTQHKCICTKTLTSAEQIQSTQLGCSVSFILEIKTHGMKGTQIEMDLGSHREEEGKTGLVENWRTGGESEEGTEYRNVP